MSVDLSLMIEESLKNLKKFAIAVNSFFAKPNFSPTLFHFLSHYDIFNSFFCLIVKVFT